MNQETEPQIARYGTATAEVPRAACGRCEDWTTVVHKGNRISPCPACRPEEYDAWLKDGNRLPSSEPTA